MFFSLTMLSMYFVVVFVVKCLCHVVGTSWVIWVDSWKRSEAMLISRLGVSDIVRELLITYAGVGMAQYIWVFTGHALGE